MTSAGSAASATMPATICRACLRWSRSNVSCVCGSRGPRSQELRARRVDQQERHRSALLDEQLLQLERRGVDPLEVLEQDDHRLQRVIPTPTPRASKEPASAPPRRGRHGRVTLGNGQARATVPPAATLPGTLCPLLPAARARAVTRASDAPSGSRRETASRLGHRVEGRVRKVGGSLGLEQVFGVRSTPRASPARAVTCRSPARPQQHDLPLTFPRPLEALKEERPLRVPSDERGEPSGGPRMEAASHAARLHHPVEVTELGDAPSVLRAVPRRRRDPPPTCGSPP